MDAWRTARRTMLVSALSALVLTLGPVGADAFNPQRDPPKQNALSPSANPPPVVNNPAITPRGPSPTASGKVFPKVNIQHMPNPPGANAGGDVPGPALAPGALGMQKVLPGMGPEGPEAKMGIEVLPFKPGAEGMQKVSPTGYGGPDTMGGEDVKGIEPHPFAPGGAEEKGIIAVDSKPAEFSPIPQGASHGNVETQFKVEEGVK